MSILLWLAAGGCMPSAGDERKTVDVVCPVDGTRFQAQEVTVSNRWGGVDADFCPHAFKTTPLEFSAWMCPGCGFAGRKADFQASLSDAERASLKTGLRPPAEISRQARQSQIPGHVKFELAAQTARLRGAPATDVGRAWLHASWSCRQQGAVDFEAFDEWETLKRAYGALRTPIDLGLKRNRTDYDLEVAAKVAKDVEAGRSTGVNRLLAPYLAAFLYRKHGENGDAERWLAALAKMKGENSVVDDAAARMSDSIRLEREFQRKAVEAYATAHASGALEPKAAAEVAYLVGELNRRLGDAAAARAWYARALEGEASEGIRQLAQTQQGRLERR